MKNPRTDELADAPPVRATLRSPKSIRVPVVAIVIYSMTLETLIQRIVLLFDLMHHHSVFGKHEWCTKISCITL